MSHSATPLNLPASALTVLQTRNATALSAIKSATDSERKVATLIAASESLAQPAASGGAIPRGQIVNILV